MSDRTVDEKLQELSDKIDFTIQLLSHLIDNTRMMPGSYSASSNKLVNNAVDKIKQGIDNAPGLKGSSGRHMKNVLEAFVPILENVAEGVKKDDD